MGRGDGGKGGRLNALSTFLQNRAAHILICACYDPNIDELCRARGWRKLEYQRFESAAVMM